jgi:Core-2/I-Branching enzyme
MRVACLVLAYAGGPVMARSLPLLRAAGWDVYIHLDRKADQTAYAASLGTALPDGCSFLDDRVEVFWGGFSMIRAELKLLMRAHSAGPYDKYVLISDDSFPVLPPRALAEYFATTVDQISLVPQPEHSPFYARYHGFYCYDHHATAIRTGDTRQRLIDEELEVKIAEIAALRKSGKAPLVVYYGSQFWGLTNESVEIVLEVVHRYGILVKSFEYSALPDELMIQSILGNYKYRSRLDTAPVYADMTHGNPKIFTVFDELPLDIQNTHAFLRKISPSAVELHAQMTTLLQAGHNLADRVTEGIGSLAGAPQGSEYPTQTQTVRLAAPEGSGDGAWHGIESFWGRRFRWTAEDTVVWDFPSDRMRPGRIRLIINTVIAPNPDFIAGCRLSFCGETKPLERDGGVLSATFECGKPSAHRVILTTPKPLSPMEVAGRPDRRPLGLAVAM